MTEQELKRAKELSSHIASFGKTKTPLRPLSAYTPTPEKEFVFDSPESIASKLNSLPGGLGKHVIKDLPTVESIIEAIKNLKGNDRIDVSNLRNGEQLSRIAQRDINMNDMRWHGGTSPQGMSSFIQVDSFTSTNNQTVFTATKTVVGTILLSVSGVNYTPTTDYTVSGNTATLTSGIPASQPVLWIYIHS